MDERQQLIRLHGWRIAFATMTAVLLLNMVLLQLGAQLFANQQIFAITMLLASSGVSIAYFVLNGAYFRGNQKGLRIGSVWIAMGVFWVFLVVQGFRWFGLSHYFGAQGLTINCFQIEMGIWSLGLGIVMVVSGWREAHAEK